MSWPPGDYKGLATVKDHEFSKELRGNQFDPW